MQFSTTLAVLGLASLGRSHMLINTPIPFGKSSLDNSPLLPDGSDFPCKQRSGVYEKEGAMNDMALGSEQPLSFTGSAVHGGGSCQISITYDLQPTKNSVWKVIHSIEGGCPMRDAAGNNGNDANAISPSKYTFKVPDNLPTGEAVLAWTWQNRVGNREMYMNCAPIMISGGASKRSDENALMARNDTQLYERDIASYNALPDMFVANVGSAGNGCATTEGKAVKYPNPGNSVEINDASFDPPVGSCGGSGGSPAPIPSSPASEAPSAPITSAPVASTLVPKPSSLPGGVFITVPAPGSDAAPTPTAAPAPSDAPVPSDATSAVVSTQTLSVVPTKATSVVPPVGTGTPGSSGALSGPCPKEGEWNCIGGTAFQQCGSGTWSTVQQLAAGTTCKSGQSAVIDISAVAKEKRAIRFSHEHFRRHVRSS